jgi:F-type H+-transporting ATPase subunit b
MGGIGSLGINGSTLIAQLINVIILFGLLYLVAYKPIMRMLDERSNKIKESMENTEYIRQQAERAEEEAAKRIEEAAKEGQEAIARATRTGEEVRQEAQQKAKVEAEAQKVLCPTLRPGGVQHRPGEKRAG